MTRLGATAVLTVGLTAVVLVLIAGHSSAATLRGSGTSTPRADSIRRDGPPSEFRISGSVGGLYPGDATSLVLTVTNPRHFAIVVTNISTAVGSPKPGCGAGYLDVAPFSGHLSVDAQSSAQVTVPVTLSHAAPDACQGAIFPLEYIGWAHEA